MDIIPSSVTTGTISIGEKVDVPDGNYLPGDKWLSETGKYNFKC